jgi:RNA polymerase sigma factor (TIGR02999 family)
MDSSQFDADLRAWSAGDQDAGNRLYASEFGELHQIAHRCLRSHGRGDQLQTTVLVNECYLKLVGAGSVQAESRSHFLALCARAMRQIIVDSARRQLAGKRDAGMPLPITLADAAGEEFGNGAPSPESIAALDQTLSELDRREPRLAKIAECRIFAGMETAEIAVTFGVTERTVQREWLRVKALLIFALQGA